MKNTSLTLKLVASTMITLPMLAIAHDHSYSEMFSFKDRQAAPVYDIVGGDRVRGAYSEIKRSDSHICVSVDTRDLPSGAYTAWWLIFNNPEACGGSSDMAGNCTMADLGNVEVEATAMWAGASVVGPDGEAHLSTCAWEGETTHEVMPVGAQMGLLDAAGAEVHVVLRSHGPAAYSEPELLGRQLNSYNGGCQTETQDGFECTELQSVVHAPRRSRSHWYY